MPEVRDLRRNTLYPCECVVSVGQVKSSLTSLDKFKSALDNLQSVKELDRSANGESYDTRFGEFLNNEENHLHQIFTFLFVIGKSLSPNAVKEELTERVQASNPHIWTNVIFSLDNYLITYCCDAGICPNPMDAYGIAIQKESTDVNILLKFYKMLGAASDITRTSGMPYWKYLSNLGTWDAEVYFSTADDPPPSLVEIRSMLH